MSEPFIFIATNRLKQGRFEQERERVLGLVDFLATNEPRLIAFNEYVNDTLDEVTVVQVHPDAASMEAHMEIVRDWAQQAYAQTLDATLRIQVFGTPTEVILESLRQQAGCGVEINRQRAAPRRIHALFRERLTTNTALRSSIRVCPKGSPDQPPTDENCAAPSSEFVNNSGQYE